MVRQIKSTGNEKCCMCGYKVEAGKEVIQFKNYGQTETVCRRCLEDIVEDV